MLSSQPDVIVIGGGPGGYVAAIRFSQMGKKVLLVERGEMGGTCVNRGCIPTKAMLHVGKMVRDVTHSERVGIKAEVSVDFLKLQKWTRSAVEKNRRGIEFLCKQFGIEILTGSASFEAPHSIIVKPQGLHVTAKNIVIATGSRPVDLPTLRVDGKKILSSDDIFELKELPKNLVIVGAGAIGVEMATCFTSLGTKVVIVEIMDRILPSFCQEVATPINDMLCKLGVDVKLKTRVVEVSYDKNSSAVTLKLDDGQTIGADYVLVAVGRKPNTGELNLGSAGIMVDEKGFVKINDRLETTSRGVFAIGDVTGLPFLAHRAMAQGECSAEIALGLRDTYPFMAIPSVVYTDPEVAIVGMDEVEASRRGYEVVVSKFPFAASGRAQTLGRLEGFVKLIAEKPSGVLLGTQMVGSNVSELIGECSVIITGSYSLEDIALGVHPHPTLSEALAEAAKMALGKPVHFKS